jgi:RHS repeat-associated protein
LRGNLTNDGVCSYTYECAASPKRSGGDAANRLTAVSFGYDGLPALGPQAQVGSVRQVINPAGSVTLAQGYDPFGNPLTSAGSGGSVFGYTGEQVDASTGLVYLRARYYSSYQGIFLSRDLVDSEPPYQYVRENPVNLVDSSGLVPTREGINRGDYSYSCNCGWIDWGHANGESASALIDKLERLNSTTEPIDISAIAFARYGYQGAVTLWISKEPNLPQDELTRVALGVFKAIQLQVEEVQGNVRIGPVPLPASGTYFSEEDLPSDLIGFYKAVWERAGVPASWSEIISRACKVLNKADSLEVFEAYQNELSQGDMGEGGFVRWRNWQGRLADSCTIQGKCGSIAGRRWPALFSTIQEYNAEQGGKWHIESGKTCWGLWGCTTPLPRD